jgi:hypothetical protein
LTVTNVQWTGTAQGITQILVTFSKPPIVSTAINPENFALADVEHGDSGVPMSVAPYQSSSLIVALTPAQPLPFNRFFQLSINGGIEDVDDERLAGDGSNPGTSYTAMLGQGTKLSYVTSAGDRVSLRITGGGILDDLLSGSGQGIRLAVVGEVPHHTVLSGHVREGRTGAGQAYLGDTIWGLGAFGDVRVKLRPPQFRISQYPFSPGSLASETQAIPSLSVAHKPASRRASTGAARTMDRPFHAFHHRKEQEHRLLRSPRPAQSPRGIL